VGRGFAFLAGSAFSASSSVVSFFSASLRTPTYRTVPFTSTTTLMGFMGRPIDCSHAPSMSTATAMAGALLDMFLAAVAASSFM